MRANRDRRLEAADILEKPEAPEMPESRDARDWRRVPPSARAPAPLPSPVDRAAVPEPASDRQVVASEEQPDKSRRQRRLRWVLYLMLPIALIAASYWYIEGGAVVTTDDAYVEADQVGLSTDVSGMVKSIDVRDNQHVAAGQVLFQLDPQPFQLKLTQAEAQLGVVRDNLDALKQNYRNVAAQIVRAQDQVVYDERQYEREAILAREGFAAQAVLDQARVNLQTAQQTSSSLKAQLAGIVADLAGNPNIAIEQYPQYRQVLAMRDEDARELRDTVVRAPFSGTVTNVPALRPGMYLPASTTAFYLVDTDRVWVEAQPKETELTHVRKGQPATVTIDTYPGRLWQGKVASIGPASQSQFSLLPAQNTSGNWVKVVQRIPVRVAIGRNAQHGLPPLRAGMSAEVSIDTGHKRGVPHFLSALFGEPRRGGRPDQANG